MSSLAPVDRVELPAELLAHGHQLLRQIGEAKVEGLVLWAGIRAGQIFRVQAVLQPAQRCIRTEAGLMVLVDGPELHRIGVWLYDHGMELGAQIHTHPTDAYHSETDDRIPVVTTEGGLSLVVPAFATGPAAISEYAVFRLQADGIWRELTPTASSSLIRILPEDG